MQNTQKQTSSENSDNRAQILILANPEYKTDSLLAILSLSQLYEDSHDVEVLAAGSAPEKLSQNLSRKNVKFIEKLPEQKFLLQFKKQENKIKSIQWNQSEDNVNLYVTMDDGNFNEKDFRFHYLGGVYEKIFLINVGSFGDFKNFKEEYKYLFEKTEVIALGKEFKDPLSNLTVAYNPENPGVSEDLYDYTQKTNLELSEKSANSILAGIYFATNNFKEQIKNPKTFETSAKLMEKGAKPADAIGILESFNK
ncbi:hypothetical protein GF389_02965 [Candidatus Dojkabacteria bacterium]|nr:hypothetical protein [Candidatus Dojkabacteria bacterium]